MEFNALVWAKAQDGQWHRGTVISREETGDLRHIKVRLLHFCSVIVCALAFAMRCLSLVLLIADDCSYFLLCSDEIVIVASL